MSTPHNIQARQIADIMLDTWRGGNNLNNILGSDVFLTRSQFDFPSPDGTFYTPSKKTRITMEFKPFNETARGVLTGVGQSIVYLNKNTASYLVVPDIVEDFPIGDYLEETFKKIFYNRLPIGLITFDPKDLTKIKWRCDIGLRLVPEKAYPIGTDTNYWAAWRDTPPHAIFLLLKIAGECTDVGVKERSKAIWDRYYSEYYAPLELRRTLDRVPSKVFFWDREEPQMTLESTKEELRKKISEGKITNEFALKDIMKRSSPDEIDNHYHDTKKNHYNFLNHLQLWDSKFNLTDVGKKLLNIGLANGENSPDFRKGLARVILIDGRHFELMNDIISAIKSAKSKPSSTDEAKAVIFSFLEEKGFIKKNSNRTTSGVRKFLSSEFNLWNNLGFIRKNGQAFYDPVNGYDFNWDLINELVFQDDKIII